MNVFISPGQIDAAVEAVRQFTHQSPSVGLVLGTGLGGLANAVEKADVIPYDQIPNWPLSTVHGHVGRLVIGKLAGKTVLAQQGRAHFYEGYSMSQITLPVRVMSRLGVETIIVTNASGGINRDFTIGDLMLITDHINMPGLAGNNPLRGPNDEAIGPRFPDLTNAYDPKLRQVALESARAAGTELRQGTYAYVAGPSFETPAELRFLHAVGADAVGMSTVPTVIAARHSGIRVVGISMITNIAILDPTLQATINHEQILETGNRIIPQLTRVIQGILSAV